MASRWSHRIAPATAGRVARWRHVRSLPTVSVVIPVYNVEAYLDECLDSVRTQSYRRLDIVLVDDGSTDRSPTIASDHARDDRRIRVVRQHNAGLGAARNTGVRHARGDLLCFVDSDDRLAPEAIRVLAESLTESGSDFAVGNIRRFHSRRAWIPQWAQQVHRRTRASIRLSDHPEILKDVFAWNKLFRSEFFRTVVGEFPEGVRYEDQEPTARAYTAGTFDVLRDVVYHWREREDGSSITQQKSNQLDLLDRLDVKSRVAKIIAAYPDPVVVKSWQAKAAGFDLRPYFEVIPRTDQDFWNHLRSALQTLASTMDDSAWLQISLIDRLPALAVLHGERDDVSRLMIKRAEYGWAIPGEVADGTVRLRSDYLADLSVRPDPALLAFSTADRAIRCSLTSIGWDGSVLELAGFAYIPGLDLSTEGATSTIELRLVAPDGSARTIDLDRETWPRIDVEANDAWSSYAPAGFRARLDTATLIDPAFAQQQEFVFEVRCSTGGDHELSRIIVPDHRSGAARIPVGPMQQHGRWVLEPAETGLLTLRHEPIRVVRVERVAAEASTVLIDLSGPVPDQVRLSCETVTGTAHSQIEPLGGDRTRLRLVLPAVPRDDAETAVLTHDWKIRIRTGRRWRRLIWPGATSELERQSTELLTRVVCSRVGTLRIEQTACRVVADGVQLRGDRVHLYGRMATRSAQEFDVELITRDGRGISSTPVTQRPDGIFTADIPLLDSTGRQVRFQGHLVRFCARDGLSSPTADTGADQPAPERLTRYVEASPALASSFPLDEMSGTSAITCTRTANGRLWIANRLALVEEDRSRWAQRRIHQIFDHPPADLDDAVVFESFNGRSVSDSGLAILELLRDRRPDLQLYCSIVEPSVPTPAGAEPLVIYSRRWSEVVHRARYLVSNANFPFFFRKQPGQIFLQTWHGTPLKKIADDVPAASLSLSYRNLMKRQVPEWDWLLAQNEFAAEALPKAFGYTGDVLDLGYPRNDSLTSAASRRSEVRAGLGLAEDQLAVLYAPTWRDNVRNVGRGYALVSHLDHAVLAAQLPSAIVLLRGHANTVATQEATSPTVVDVSRHPDVNELMIAADVLITDYSSIMFDFCVTGKPILFLVPDYEQYRDVTRGFYLSLPDIAPGPLCGSTAEILTELRRLPEFQDRFGERYAGFARRFAPRDDGSATARVVGAVWGPQLDRPLVRPGEPKG